MTQQSFSPIPDFSRYLFVGDPKFSRFFFRAGRAPQESESERTIRVLLERNGTLEELYPLEMIQRI